MTGRPRWWVAGLLLLAAAAASAVLLRSGVEPSPTEPEPATWSSADRASAAADVLRALAGALAERSREDAVALVGRGDRESAGHAATLVDNARALRLQDVGIRYIDEARPPAAGPRAEWLVDAEVTWRIAGFERIPSRMEVSFELRRDGERAALVRAGAESDNRVPLWMLSPLDVARSGRTLVVAAASRGADKYTHLAEQAVADVRRVLPRWNGRVVVEVPATQTDLDRLLGAEPGTYEAIAALTATVDGSILPQAPVHVFVNPAVFDGLGEDGAQIVMSHEATHVATQAATATMPMWLLEGFADYVALVDVDLPVTVTAGQILQQVRRDGPPDSLPGPNEFDLSGHGLGAAYESAWLACRYLAETHGERQLVAFYRTVSEGATLSRAFADVLGTDEQSFTAGWQDYLRRLAD